MINPRFEKFSKLAAAREKWAKNLAPEIRCDAHPGQIRLLDQEQSFRTRRATYSSCAECVEGKAFEAQKRELHRAGVPTNLLAATLNNWTPRDRAEASHLAACVEFSKKRSGFLLLIGDVGTGKTHLAVGLMRFFRAPVIFKQGTLLRELRATYRDRHADDPIEKCQDSDLFVLDEIGMSSGGRDELPMLHEILDFRFAEYKPTILTSNLSIDELREAIGPRLTDRLRQAAFRILIFRGESHRAGEREAYFSRQPAKPASEVFPEAL